MKQYLLILISILVLSSCSLDDNDTPNYYFEYVPITTVDVPQEFIFGENYELVVRYELPNECYGFYNFDYIYDNTSREIYTIAIVNEDLTCEENIIEGEYTINVHARQSEPYTFKFWQGKDDQGIDQYLIVEVPVN